MTGSRTARALLRRLRLSAELTRRTAAAQRAQLFEPLDSGHDLEIDLGSVRHIDAAGLQLLVKAKLHALATGRLMRLTHHSAAVRDLIGGLGTCGVFHDEPPAAGASSAGPESRL